MPSSINNNNPADVHDYFRHASDSTQVKTAQRSSFLPTYSNKIANRFAQHENKFIRGIGQLVNKTRNADLTLREKFADPTANLQRRYVNITTRMSGALKGASGDADQVGQIQNKRGQKLDEIGQKRDFKLERLKLKREINQAAATGDMEQKIQESNEGFQHYLRKRNYVQVEGLSATELPQYHSNFLHSQDGHTVKIHSDRPPLLARKVAGEVSRQYDTGATGVNKVLRSGILHGAVGIHNAGLWTKQQILQQAAKSKHLDVEIREASKRGAYRAAQKRELNNAAMRGNQALADKFNKVVGQQSELSINHSNYMSDSKYVIRRGNAGVAPAKTGYVARRMNEYFAGAEGEQTTKKQKMASFFIGLMNLGPSISASHHANHVAKINWKQRGAWPSESEKEIQRSTKHSSREFNARFIKSARQAAVQGNMIDELRARNHDLENRYPTTEFLNRELEAEADARARLRPQSPAPSANITELDDSESVTDKTAEMSYTGSFRNLVSTLGFDMEDAYQEGNHLNPGFEKQYPGISHSRIDAISETAQIINDDDLSYATPNPDAISLSDFEAADNPDEAELRSSSSSSSTRTSSSQTALDDLPRPASRLSNK